MLCYNNFRIQLATVRNSPTSVCELAMELGEGENGKPDSICSESKSKLHCGRNHCE